MRSRPATSSPIAPTDAPPAPVRPHWLLTLLAGLAFVLLAAAVCIRPLFREYMTVLVPELLAPPGSTWQSGPAGMFAASLLAAAGMAAAALWLALTRRRWIVSGLEIGAILIAVAAALAFSHVSDKRVALNAAIGTILPLLIGVMLCQLLARRVLWRRALLAAVTAIAAANAAKSTAQRHHEYEQEWREYQQQREQIWAQIGRTADDPMAREHEARLKARQPVGYFFHTNVTASFLLLGLAGTLAAVTGLRRRHKTLPVIEPVVILPTSPLPDVRAPTGQVAEPSPPSVQLTEVSQPGRLRPVAAVLVGLVLAALAVWFVVIGYWIGSVGALAGLVAMGLTVPAGWLLRERPRTLAAILLAGGILLQGTLLAMALRAPSLYQDLEAYGGKVRSFAFRLNYWEGSLRLLAQRPVEGVGPGQFTKYYTAVKQPYASEALLHPHNWLFNQAAEYGTLGLAGLLIALLGAGWRIIRSLRVPLDPSDRSLAGPLLPALVVLLVCWALVWPAGWSTSLGWAIGASLVAMVCVGLSGLFGWVGQVILLAGLVGFFVHASVEMASGVPGAAWPFWALAAVAMTWRHSPDELLLSGLRAVVRPGLLVPVAAAAAVVVLTIPPLRAARHMRDAQQAMRAGQPERALQFFQQAAGADRFDPAPLKAAALLHQRLARLGPSGSMEHLRQAIAIFETVRERDPDSYMVWRNLAIARMYLATWQDDFGGVRRAVEAMQRSLALYPNWPAGWQELAGMAGVQSGTQPDRADLLRIADEAAGKALALDDLWPAGDAHKFTSQGRDQLKQLRRDVAARLRGAR